MDPKLKKVSPNRSLFDEIPTPIIWDILLRLPTKACLNCKLVCKEWYHIIISLEFGDLRSSHIPFFTIMLYGKFDGSHTSFALLELDKSLDVDMKKGDLNVRSEDVIKFQPKFTIPHEKLMVVNECNGLVCLMSSRKWTPLIVYNPLTDEEVIVEQVREPDYYMVQVYGLGCCPVSSQFKILRILLIRDGYIFRVEAQIFTINGADEWRTVGEAPADCFCIGTAFLHGSLHNYTLYDNCIWSFQFRNEKFLRIPLPEGMKPNIVSCLGEFVDVNVSDSCLSLLYKSKGSLQCDLWVMKEYGNKDSWVKLLVLDDEIPTLLPMFQMNDKKMLVSHARGCCYDLRILDVESGEHKGLKVLGVDRFNRVMVCNLRFSKL